MVSGFTALRTGTTNTHEIARTKPNHEKHESREKEIQMEDFYCEQVLSGKVRVKKVFETDNVLAYHHTRPFWETHIVVIPKKHVDSLLTVNKKMLDELLDVVKTVAAKLVGETGAARVLTNLGEYQDSKHLHFHVNSGKQTGE